MANKKETRTLVEVEVAGFSKKDNAEVVTMAKNCIEVYTITFRTKRHGFYRCIDSKRLRKKASSSTGVLILNYPKEGGKWNKEGWAYNTKLH